MASGRRERHHDASWKRLLGILAVGAISWWVATLVPGAVVAQTLEDESTEEAPANETQANEDPADEDPADEDPATKPASDAEEPSDDETANTETGSEEDGDTDPSAEPEPQEKKGDDAAAGDAEESDDSAVKEKVKPRFVDLSEAISLGLTRSPQIEAQQYATQKAAARYDEADWLWTPKLKYQGFIAPFPEVDDASKDEEDLYTDLGGWGIYTRHELEIGMPVFTFFKIATAEDLAEIGLDVERLKEEETRLKVTLDVTRAYYGLQLAKAMQVVTAEAEKLILRIEDKYWELWDSGADGVKRSDRYRIEIAREEALAGNGQAKEAIKLAETALRVHTGLDESFRVPKMRFKPDEVVLKPLDDVQLIAEQNRLDLQMLNHAVEAAGLNQDLAFWQWFPDFAIGGTLRFSYNNVVPENDIGFYADDPYNTFGFGVALTATWKVDPVRQSFKMEQADAQFEQVKSQRELARRGANLEVEKFYRAAVTNLENVGHARRARRAAKSLFTQELLDYEVGGGDVKDPVDAGSQYIEKRLLYLLALNEFRISLAKLRLATGAQSVNDLLAEGKLLDYESADENGEEADDD